MFVLLFIAVFLFLGLSNVWDKKLSHELPYGYLASDSFLHQANSDYIKQRGTVMYSPPYLAGGHEDVLHTHPLVLLELATTFSYLTGLETYDTMFFITVFMTLLGILTVYLIIRKYSVNVAMLSLPVTVLIFSKLFNLGLWWGLWHFMVGVAFMIGSVWCFTNLNLKSMFLMLGILIAATISEHIPEAVFIAGFFILLFILNYLKEKKVNFADIKHLAYAGLIGVVLSAYYIFVFMNSFFITEGFRGTPAKGYFGFPDIFIQSLGYLGIVFLIGAVLFFFFIKKNNLTPGIFAVYMFVVSYLTYVGFGKRAFTHRFFWHTYLAFFFGVAIYYLAKLIIKKWDLRHSFAVAVILLIAFAYPLNAQTKVGQGLMDKPTWSALKWIEKNTKEDVRVYYFVYPGDGLSQAAAIYNSKRLGFKISYKNVIASLEEGKINKTYKFPLSDAWETLLCKRSLFDYGSYKYALTTGEDVCEDKIYIPEAPNPETYLCDIEYYYFNKVEQEKSFEQFNLFIRQELLKNSWIKEVYSNEMVSILKNENPGADCLG